MADLNKLMEEIKAMTVLELNDFVKALEEEEKTEFDVVLKEVGPNKVQVIKVVKDATGLGLVEAKGVVDGAPKTVKEAMPKDAAEALVAKFKEVGATAELK